MKEIVIKVSTVIDGSSDNEMELVTTACYDNENGKHSISYDESEISGMESTKTTLSIDVDNTVTLIRTGGNNMSISYKKGQKSASIYNTPYGDFDMIVTTDDVIASIEDDTLMGLRLVYDMELKGLVNSKNEIDILVIG